ncbi:MAG: hypothetical protein OJI67_06230 [Prosthecobacter sp.]|nr:hypothetical protein [Prosthecobacter sp.]
MTHAHDRHLQTGIAGSLAIHVFLLFLLVLVLGSQPAHDFLKDDQAAPKKEPTVTLIFPNQLIPEPPPEPVKQPQKFIRTTQNEASKVVPKNAPFQSDRNTIAASIKPPLAGSTVPMPTLDGNVPNIGELANRDYRDGEFKNDSAAKSEPSTPQHPTPEPPLPASAKVQPAPTPLKKMMEEMDEKVASKDKNRLPLEIRKADTKSPDDLPTKPAPPKVEAPKVRMPEDTPPKVVKAVPVEDPIQNNTPNPEKNAFSPFTRTSKTDGSISREGQDAVDAEATPLGIYMRQVTDAVGKKWHLYVQLGKDSVTFGRVRFRFYVDKKGTPQDLKILSDARDADPRMRELTLRAILDAQIPPIPADLLTTLDDGRVKIEYEAIIY